MMGKFKKSPSNETMLYIRKGLSKGMKLLSQNYQIAIFTLIKEEYKIKFLVQALKNKKLVFDAMYKKTGDESEYDIYDQIFIDFQIITSSSKAVTVCPYYSEDGSKVIYSYPGYNRLHPMFQNICAREKVIDFDDMPT